MKNLKWIFLTLFLSFGLAACEQQGPAEELGENIDEAAEEVGDAMEDACEDVKDAAGADDTDC